MHQLVYTSAASAPFTDIALRTLLAAARARNSAVDVTGLLLHQAGTFLQVLEGMAEPVEGLYQRIARDPRHQKVLVLNRRELAERNFADWSMGFVDIRGTANRLPGFRRIGDLTGLIGDTVAIEKVISSFRDGRWRNYQAA